MSIAKRPPMVKGHEYDAFCDRRTYCYLRKPGVSSSIKRSFRRRWRSTARAEIAAALTD